MQWDAYDMFYHIELRSFYQIAILHYTSEDTTLDRFGVKSEPCATLAARRYNPKWQKYVPDLNQHFEETSVRTILFLAS